MIFTAAMICISGIVTQAADLTIDSPDANIKAVLTFNEKEGTLSYRVQSSGQEIIAASPIGIHTDRGDFRTGMRLAGTRQRLIDETYRLPQGKVSIYRNLANEVTLNVTKENRSADIVFRVYNDGIAFCFALGGRGEIAIYEESSSIKLSGENFEYWGQDHPNSYAYESALGPIDGQRMSIPVLAHLQDRDHYVLMGQAATYGHYIQPHFLRSGATFAFSFPLDQAELGPVRANLPFQSPWRMVVISPDTPARIVESYLAENLNPPTDPGFLNPDGMIQDWVRPGRVVWDFIAGDKDKPGMWTDAAASMGWEYYLADAGFSRQWGGEDAVRKATAYAASKNVGIIGWAHTRDFDTRQKTVETLQRYADMGLKGAKIDFFDHNTLSDPPNRVTNDYEDTQRSLQMRDWILQQSIDHKFLLEFHGCTIPAGERRRYPNLMTFEAVNGMEKRTPTVANDLTIPYIRNVVGPVSYTVIRFSKSPGSHAYQLAMPIVYEAGLMIYAEHGQKLLDWPGSEMLRKIPAAWDEIRFIDGSPTDFVIVARRKGQDWFIGGMTAKPRTATVSLTFLDAKNNYSALIFSDLTHTDMLRRTQTVSCADSLKISLQENGGFAVHLAPVPYAREASGQEKTKY